MRCSTFSKSLKDYIAEELSEDASEMMSSHINKCDRCKALYNNQLKSYKFLQSMSSSDNSLFESSRDEIMKNIDKSKYNKTFTNKVHFFMKKNSFKCALGAVAVAALIFTYSVTGNHLNDLKLTSILPNKLKTAHVSPSKAPTPTKSPTPTENVTPNKDVPPVQNQENVVPKKYEDINYENKQLGFSLTIPGNWTGKYTIKETADGIGVYFKPVNPDSTTEGYGLLFGILKESAADAGILDIFGESRTFKAKGIKYIIYFPTDVNFDENHQEFQDFMNFKTQVDDVVKTIEVMNTTK